MTHQIIHFIEHALIDVLWLVPFLFITYFILEIIEHKIDAHKIGSLIKNRKGNPIFAALIGLIPQHGIAVIGANFYAARLMSFGTIIALFLASSDDTLPILIANNIPINTIIQFLGIKLIIAIIVGLILDCFIKKQLSPQDVKQKIHEMCHGAECNCHHGSLLGAALKHTLSTSLFIFIIVLVLNALFEMMGPHIIEDMITQNPFLSVFFVSVFGLIPTCSSSVIIAQLFASGVLSLPLLICTSLCNVGIGMLALFKSNKPFKQNIYILGILFMTSIISGLLLTVIL